MKASLYNVLAPTRDGSGSILYNTRSQTCVLLDAAEAQQYRQIAEGALEEGDLFAQLDELGFLVDARQTEHDFMRYEYEKAKFENECLELAIAPTLDFGGSDRERFGTRREGAMPRAVQQAIVDFVREQREHQPFTMLSVTWLVGNVEDAEAAEAVDWLDAALRAYAEEAGVQYVAMAVACGDATRDAVAQRLACCEAEDVEDSQDFEGCRHGGDLPADEDFVVPAGAKAAPAAKAAGASGAVVDLRKDGSPLGGGHSVNVNFDVSAGLTNFAAREDAGLQRNLKDKALAQLAQFLDQDPDRDDFEQFLQPLDVYCEASVERSYAIDPAGNAYGTVRDLGAQDRVLFNVCEPMETRAINMKLIARYGNANPLDLEECASCSVFPLCCGGCARVRVEEGALTCVPQRFMIEEYLTAYSGVL